MDCGSERADSGSEQSERQQCESEQSLELAEQSDESEQRENTFVWRTLSESVTDLLDLVNQSAEISDTGTGCFGQRMQPCQQYLHIMIVTELKKDELSVRTLAEILMK